jgi:hypothetical protein
LNLDQGLATRSTIAAAAYINLISAHTTCDMNTPYIEATLFLESEGDPQ